MCIYIRGWGQGRRSRRKLILAPSLVQGGKNLHSIEWNGRVKWGKEFLPFQNILHLCRSLAFINIQQESTLLQIDELCESFAQFCGQLWIRLKFVKLGKLVLHLKVYIIFFRVGFWSVILYFLLWVIVNAATLISRCFYLFIY